METRKPLALEAYWDALSRPQRAELADKIGTSVSYLRFICKGNKRVSLGRAQTMVLAMDGSIGIDDLPLADDARRQLEMLRSHRGT